MPPLFLPPNKNNTDSEYMAEIQQGRLAAKKRLSDILFILWAGGAALLSYSLVYALRKPYTAAVFEDVDFFGLDYKVVVTVSQIVGYVISKFMGTGRTLAVYFDVGCDGRAFACIFRPAVCTV